MIRRPAVATLSCMRSLYKSVTNLTGLPQRNRVQDYKRIKRILQALHTNKYDDMKVPSIDQLIKCLYVTKPLKVSVGVNKEVGLRQMNEEGRQLLKSEFLAAKNLFNTRNLNHFTGLRKSLMMDHQLGKITQKFFELNNLQSIARIPIPENRLSKKILFQQDLKVLNIVIACLAHYNNEAIVREFIQNEVTKPTLRNLFGL
ncbi:uncharacterized protein KLLA0_B03212g [Kluyveromyces lactis]|uniref:KLLA0B03212p n=1 Tax=Kluyveromyces lactis (strain ATCC 8585 / CBS 2359 / DSM 70799 / NBRC 1267 / NRRL Y-1140 / WM37) TaxID=284590 RepID=Q6CWL3_KLULA|nr:uncharacterized protein KLLA0_B03212g [Kluyveromyces lactis]CAH02069.1 KLLA0B03212p [Kluyveromyces lactis]|eukprot:XP_451676.1 uncharacterized protein KLLA0_B03212g [Kluyveromyces lactis]